MYLLFDEHILPLYWLVDCSSLSFKGGIEASSQFAGPVPKWAAVLWNYKIGLFENTTPFSSKS